ncbi:TaqI-like C-terminal specificity domain-containing protein [Helicobacter sp. 11S02629-2]|uniref:TaqI-like C-terminal specificity domain-containing protein n=1 Tax=Helicobacter sp. 11S02629-2 TaxID=1476195 RepID=UPI000BC3E43E|nr:TaqI-like C-terminal specificity domain-containing protein [Helicobacter sp. 11S02629-2]PAF45609.1 hypothetical protein BKH40_01640 [Helicobacter sp. 11S02629-2]
MQIGFNNDIRPILRGRDIKRYSYNWAGLWIINTHNGYIDSKGNKIPRVDIEEHPTLKLHFDSYYDKLIVRSDKGDTPYNLRNCAYIGDFARQKIVYPNMASEFVAVYDKEGYMTNQKCFIITSETENLEYLTSVLNSKLNFWYFKLIGATLGASGYEMSKIFVEKLPIIKPSFENSNLIKSITYLASEILKFKKENKDASLEAQEVDSMIYKLYNLSIEEIELIESKG